jgi:hypothetical protein
MDHSHEYQQEVKKVQDKDFTHNWVTSSAFLFYLQIACVVAFIFGGCFMLSKAKYKGKPEVTVQESTLYTPNYK